MKKLMTAAAAIALFSGIGMAGASAATSLTDTQLDHVTAGGGVLIAIGTVSAASGFAAADWGYASSSSHTGAVNDGDFSASWASNHSHAFGADVVAGSSAASASGAIAVAH